MEESCEQAGTEAAQPAQTSKKRRCEHTMEGGRRCGRWATHGEELCHQHLRYAQSRVDSRVNVPLLEDEASIAYVLSQTAQALATGGMPPANGNAVISACKLATRVMELRLKQAQWELKHGEFPSRERSNTVEVHAAPSEEDPGDATEARDKAVEGDASLMAVSDDADDAPVENPGAFERARARVEAEEAAQYAREGPHVKLPRFRKEDLAKQWETGTSRPWTRNENNWWITHEEAEEIQGWRRRHADLVRAQEKRMLDEYFGRVKNEETAGGA